MTAIETTASLSGGSPKIPCCPGLIIELRDAIEEVSTGPKRHRLVLLAGEPRSGKTTALRALSDETGWPLLSLNLPLSERLLEIPTRFRVIRVLGLVRDIIDASDSDVLIIDNIELLFEQQLQADPVGLLLELARHRTIIASWPGAHDGAALVYADPTHPEHRRIPHPDCLVVQSRLTAVTAAEPHPQVEP